MVKRNKDEPDDKASERLKQFEQEREYVSDKEGEEDESKDYDEQEEDNDDKAIPENPSEDSNTK